MNNRGFQLFLHELDQKPQLLVRPAGIEPATLGFGGQYSIH
jgi:hypothetical protein